MDRTAEELTILLTLNGRDGFTARWLAYAERVRLPFRVLIADGGAGRGLESELTARRMFPAVRYDYLRYRPDASYADFYAKVDDALGRVDTPLVALADNDDFLAVDGVRDAVAFLNAHPDYATCGGQCGRFWVDPASAGDADPLFGRAEWKCSLDDRSLTADRARDRLRQQSLRSTYPVYYHVQRTVELRAQVRILREIDLRDLFLVEYLLSFLSAISGKARQLETLYLARQSNSPASAGGAHKALFGDWLGRMLVPTWSRDFTRFVDATSQALAARDGMAADEARRWVIETYRMLVAPSLLEDVMREPPLTLRGQLSRAGDRCRLRARSVAPTRWRPSAG